MTSSSKNLQLKSQSGLKRLQEFKSTLNSDGQKFRFFFILGEVSNNLKHIPVV